MNRTFVLAPALLCVLAMAGCSVNGRLYPVQGPLASQAPPPVYNAKLTAPPGLMLTAVLGNGESFKGKMKILAGPPVSSSTDISPVAAPPQTSLASAWDRVYGQGYYVAHVLGGQLGQAVLTGDHGTVIQVEIWNARGVAVDNKGNVYKLAFAAEQEDQH